MLSTSRARGPNSNVAGSSREPANVQGTPREVINLISDSDSDEESDEVPIPRVGQARTGAPTGATQVTEDISRTKPDAPHARRTTSAPSHTITARTQPSERPRLPPPSTLPLHRTQSQPSGPSVNSTARKRSRSKSTEQRELRHSRRQIEERERRRTRRPTRAELENEWTVAALNAGSRGIKIVNDVDLDDIPDVPDDFEWLERGYEYSPQDYRPEEEDRRDPCICTGNCGELSRCDCFDLSDLCEFGQNMAAYTKNGRLMNGLERLRTFLVHECTDRCPCAPTCRNRVAQWPREVGFEIFKTERCGWGVRTTSDLPKGKVLGIYTGELSRCDQPDDEEDYEGHSSREPSSEGDSTLDVETSDESDVSDVRGRGRRGEKRRRLTSTEERELRKSYEFYLDWDNADTWLVGAYRRGNWSRFLNHCCDPNLGVYSMTCDTDPKAKHLPTYLVFFTKRAIPAGQELTFDYDPRYSEKKYTEKQKRRAKDKCFCGAANCRGFMRLPGKDEKR